MKHLISVLFIILGIFFFRKIDQLIGGIFLKGILDKFFIYLICIIWGTFIAFGVREFILYFNLNIILVVICYGAGLYGANIFYQDKRADIIYGYQFTDTVNWITIIVNVTTSIIFYFVLK